MQEIQRSAHLISQAGRQKTALMLHCPLFCGPPWRTQCGRQVTIACATCAHAHGAKRTALGTRAHHSVHIVHTHNELLEEPACLALFQPAFPHNVLKHIPPCCILHGDRQVLLRQKHLRGRQRQLQQASCACMRAQTGRPLCPC